MAESLRVENSRRSMEQAAQQDAAAITTNKGPWSALVIDDDAGVRQSLRLCLEAAGARVLGVARGGAALEALDRGRFDVAPRGHPNDGAVELVDVAPTFGLVDRVKAWRRLPTGTHVPHPDITVRRVRAQQETFEPPLPVWLDGVPLGPVHHLSLRVEADALTVLV